MDASNEKLMLCSTSILFLMLIILVFLHTCRHRHRRHDVIIRTDDDSSSEELRPSSALKLLSTFTFSSAIHGALNDCAVCLSEFSDGEEGRVLPNCNHAFHSLCIDAWFRSHTNCPLCRTPVHQLATPAQPPRTASSHVEPGPLSFACRFFSHIVNWEE